MKSNIHPEYNEITVIMTDGTQFKTKSTLKSATLQLDVDKKTHPAWTGGDQRLVDTAGQISKFGKKYQNFGLS